jgi:phosphopantothenoylcysteine decarboxylase / phosphopantothenate---cysteine ligase
MSDSTGSNILLGITGSIAAYKAPSVARGLMALGHSVRAVMTKAACEFITPTTLRAVTGQPVVTCMFIPESQAGLEHIHLADWADAFAVVPATANFLGKAAGGIADDILSCTWMACDCAKLIAPAMNDRMWRAPATQRNVRTLSEDLPELVWVGPTEGKLASGKIAMGHLAPVDDIVAAIDGVCR